MKIFGIFLKKLSKKSLFKIPSFNFSSELFAKLLQLKESPNEKINELINETLPILLQKPGHINELIEFFQEFEKNNTIKIGFPIYLNLYSNFFQKYPKTINISSLDKLKITALVDLLIQFPDLLENNKGFFNSIDLYFTKNKDFPPETLLKVFILAMKINRGSDKLISELEKIKDFSKLSIETLLNWACSLRKTDIVSLDFAKIIYSEIQNRKNEILPKNWLETLYIASLLNVPDLNELFIIGIKNLNSMAFRRNLDVMRILWIMMYFEFKYNQKSDSEILENLVSNLKNSTNKQNNPILAYKLHEIQLFLRKKYPETFEKYWKYENFMMEKEWFKGGMETIGSILQKDVEIILKIANIDFEREKRIEKIYIVDFFIKENSVILEINGPSHYSFNKKSQDKLLNGRSFIKGEILKMYGLKVQNISYKRWYELKGVREKLNFVNNLVYNGQ